MAKKKSVEWETLKSGARKGPGNWFASQYSTGWYFVFSDTTASYNPKSKLSGEFKQLGPFKTFAEGLTEWEKKS